MNHKHLQKISSHHEVNRSRLPPGMDHVNILEDHCGVPCLDVQLEAGHRQVQVPLHASGYRETHFALTSLN